MAMKVEQLKLCDSDYRFMCVVWEHAPLGSGELVKFVQRDSRVEEVYDLYYDQETVRKRVHQK